MRPPVSICIPTLGREWKLERLLRAIPKTAEWPHEVVVKFDDWPPNNRGCPTVLADCVADSAHEFVCYLGNDCIPQQGWLRLAMEAMERWFPEMDGIIALGDSYWRRGELPLHWVASKKLLPALGGYFFYPGYQHCCCDSELWGRAVALNKYVHCPEAMIYHDHPIMTGFKPEDVQGDPVYRLAYNNDIHARDRALLEARAKEFGFRIRENFQAPRIPRKAFTFWLGDAAMPPLVEKCIASQKEFTKGWEHRVITLADIPRDIPYVEQAIAAKRWVKCVDFFKFWWLYQYGGIYFDGDVEILRPFPEEMLTDRLFAGRERLGWIGNGVIGAEPGHPVLGACLERVQRDFRGDDDRNFESSVQVLTETAHSMGLEANGVKLYPPEVFTPYDHQAKKVELSGQSVTYHHFMVSWGFPTVPPWIDLRKFLPADLSDKRVLNISLGRSDSGLMVQMLALPFARVHNVEIHQPYIDIAKERFWVAKEVTYSCCDIREYPIAAGEYDIVLCMDLLEHLPREDALALIERMKATGAHLVIFGPLEKELQNHREGVDEIESQEHLSLWSEQDFKDLGFATTLVPNFHAGGSQTWDAVWAVMNPDSSVRSADEKEQASL